MKQSSITILLALFMSMVSTKASAHDIAVANTDGVLIYYVWTNNHSELAVSYRGNRYGTYTDTYSGDLVIPESVEYQGESYGVTSIGERAFYNCSNLVSITFPNCIVNIGHDAFYGTAWYNNLPDGLVYVGNVAYKYKGKMPTNAEISIKEGTIKISDDAFRDCRNLKSLSIPNSITSIGMNAFNGCSPKEVYIPDIETWCNIEFENSDSNPLRLSYTCHLYEKGKEVDLENLVIPDGIENIGNCAFTGITSLCSVSIPKSVKTIGEYAFASCSKLSSITLSEGVEVIGKNAFDYCNFSSITIPSSVTSIGDNAFHSVDVLYRSKKIIVGISDLKSWCSIVFSSEKANPLYYAKQLLLNGEVVKDDVVIPAGTTIISDYAFYNFSELSSVTLPSSLTNIGKDAFGGECKLSKIISLIEVPFPLATNAFADKTITVFIPKGTLSLYQKDWSFFDDFYEGDGSRPDDAIAFEDPVVESICTSNWDLNHDGFLSITEAGLVTELGNPFADRSSQITSFNELQYFTNLKSISQNAFSGCRNLKTLTIPENVSSIGAKAFYYCERLSSIVIPSGVTSIGSYAFQGCKCLNSVTIPNGVTSIGDYAFEDCSSLNSVTIPASVTSIGNLAFHYYTDLTVTDPMNPNYDGPRRGLLHIYISDLTAWCKIFFGQGVFTSNCATYDLYLNNKKIDHLVIPEEVKSISDRAFSYCNSINTVTIPNGVTSIGSSAFYKCSNLTSVTIPASVTSIGDYAFNGYTDLAVSDPMNPASDGLQRGLSIYISDLAAWCNISFGKDAFKSNCATYELYLNNKIINHLVIPKDVKSISSRAFNYCNSINTVTLHDEVISIGMEAFQGCENLTLIDLPNSVTSLGNLAFASSGLIVARIGKGVNKVSNAFSNSKDLEFLIFTSEQLSADINQSGAINDNCCIIIPHQAYENGISEEIKNFATYSDTPIIVKVIEKHAISAELELSYADDLFSKKEEVEKKTVTVTGQTPEQYLRWQIDEENYGIVSEKADALIIETQEPKSLSTTKGRLLADVQEVDDVERFGFEWRRIDAPDLIASSKVKAPLFNGKIIGTLSNLNPDVYYKYRPFYQSDSGEMFYGEWIGLFTGDADVYFEPEVYTKDAADITKVSALLAGVWFEGTDDFQEKGFEYWTVSGSKTRGVGSDVKKVVVSGNAMTATLEGLKAGTKYGYRSYVKTTSGSTTYGEEKTFQTILIGDADGDGKLTNADADAIAKYIMGQTPTGFKKKMADVNEDGYVNVADIVLLVKMIEK